MDCVQVVTQRSKGWITVEDDDDGYQHAYKLPRDQVKKVLQVPRAHGHRAPPYRHRAPMDTARRATPRAHERRTARVPMPRAWKRRAPMNAYERL